MFFFRRWSSLAPSTLGQASLLGSVFSNMLLVLGCCFFFGGLKHKEQRFNATSAIANMSLLLLSSLALVLPAPLSHAAVSQRENPTVWRHTSSLLCRLVSSPT